MTARGLSAAAVSLALAVPVAAGRRVDPPSGVGGLTIAGETLVVWPFTTSNFEHGDDPVNLVFLNTDPRAIRQELMELDGSRTGLLAPFTCTWTDAMGYEQAAYGEPEGWVGGGVQLACLNDFSKPLGDPFRFHVRLFRIGEHTLGAAHFEVQIPGTAEHEVLSWDLARDFVAGDMARAGAPPQDAQEVFTPVDGAFRVIRWPVYAGLITYANYLESVGKPELRYLLTVVLGLPATAPAADVPILTDGEAIAFTPVFTLVPEKYDVTTSIDVPYSVDGPKPFCGPALIHIAGGPLHLEMRVQTNRAGQYLRTYTVGGMLDVTPLAPAGDPARAVISEMHRAMVTDRYDEVRQTTSQVLLSDPAQYRATRFGAGHSDYFAAKESCGF